VLEHVADPDRVLVAITRLIRPTGRAVITFPNDPLITRAKGILKRSGASKLPPLKGIDWGGDRYHLHVWNTNEMRSLLSRHFEVSREAQVPSRLAPVRCCYLVRPRRY
jgi:hypothetical protein